MTVTHDEYTADRIHDLVRRHAPVGLGAQRLAVLTLIIRRNCLSGRVGRIQRRSSAGPEGFMSAYVGQVAATREREYSAWRDAQCPENHAALYARLLAHATAIVPQFAWVAGGGLGATDIANEAFIALVADQRIRTYPFDTPFETWLRQFVWLRARRLSQPGPTRRVQAISLSYLDEESALSLPTSCLCGGSGCGCPDKHLDQAALFARLTPDNRQVARMWLEGNTVEETARALGLTVAAVNNRRARIRSKFDNSAAR